MSSCKVPNIIVNVHKSSCKVPSIIVNAHGSSYKVPNIIVNVHRSSCKVLNILLRFLMKLDFHEIYSKNIQVSTHIRRIFKCLI